MSTPVAAKTSPLDPPIPWKQSASAAADRGKQSASAAADRGKQSTSAGRRSGTSRGKVRILGAHVLDRAQLGCRMNTLELQTGEACSPARKLLPPSDFPPLLSQLGLASSQPGPSPRRVG